MRQGSYRSSLLELVSNVLLPVRLLVALHIQHQVHICVLFNVSQDLFLLHRVEPSLGDLVRHLELGHIQALPYDVVIAHVIPDCINNLLLLLILQLQGGLPFNLLDVTFDQLVLSEPVDFIKDLLLQLLLGQFFLLLGAELRAEALRCLLLFLLLLDYDPLDFAGLLVFDIYADFGPIAVVCAIDCVLGVVDNGRFLDPVLCFFVTGFEHFVDGIVE